MEDGKRKKKNKKNKGKLTKTAENVSELTRPSLEEALQTGPEGNHESVPEQNHQEPDPGTVGTQNVSVSESEGELERHKAKESKLADLEETVKHFQSNIISCIEKEANLEKKIELLQNENEFFVKKEISWNLKFEQLQSEIHSWSLKEASLENRLTTVEHEDSRIWNENSVSEMISRLEEANTGLRMQVKELERSRDTLVQGNQQLTSSFSLLEARVQDLESEAACFRLSAATMTKHIADDRDSVKQVETVTEPSEKSVAVETELVGKVNQQNGDAEHSATCHASSTEPDLITLSTTHLSPHAEKVSELTDKFASSETVFETINIADADADVDHIASGVHLKDLPLLDDLNESTEIVQIPLDGNQAQQEEAQDTKTDEEVGVPLSDAPLIGAPFRLFSFVAQYVSGADLVENRHNSDR